MYKWGLRKNEELHDARELRDENLPRHVAIIMDGNGRWAERRGLPRFMGHRAGMKAMRNIIRVAREIGIEVLTLYAFSTENWKRPREEVDFLMRLPQEYLLSDLPELIENNVRVRILGDLSGLPRHTLEAVERAMRETAHNTGMIVNFALNYGSRAEITHAVRRIAEEVKAGRLDPLEIDERHIAAALLTAGLPDPDLLIRTSGELRISNFLLWQIAYTELWFTEVCWPDFTAEHFRQALRDYQSRTRRYGAVKP